MDQTMAATDEEAFEVKRIEPHTPYVDIWLREFLIGIPKRHSFILSCSVAGETRFELKTSRGTAKRSQIHTVIDHHVVVGCSPDDRVEIIVRTVNDNDTTTVLDVQVLSEFEAYNASEACEGLDDELVLPEGPQEAVATQLRWTSKFVGPLSFEDGLRPAWPTSRLGEQSISHVSVVDPGARDGLALVYVPFDYEVSVNRSEPLSYAAGERSAIQETYSFVCRSQNIEGIIGQRVYYWDPSAVTGTTFYGSYQAAPCNLYFVTNRGRRKGDLYRDSDWFGNIRLECFVPATTDHDLSTPDDTIYGKSLFGDVMLSYDAVLDVLRNNFRHGKLDVMIVPRGTVVPAPFVFVFDRIREFHVSLTSLMAVMQDDIRPFLASILTRVSSYRSEFFVLSRGSIRVETKREVSPEETMRLFKRLQIILGQTLICDGSVVLLDDAVLYDNLPMFSRWCLIALMVFRYLVQGFPSDTAVHKLLKKLYGDMLGRLSWAVVEKFSREDWIGRGRISVGLGSLVYFVRRVHPMLFGDDLLADKMPQDVDEVSDWMSTVLTTGDNDENMFWKGDDERLWLDAFEAKKVPFFSLDEEEL